MECKYCGEKDESRLIMSTKAVNGNPETSYICLSCLWLKEFEAEEENGKLLSKRKAVKRRKPVRKRISKKPKSSYSRMGKETD